MIAGLSDSDTGRLVSNRRQQREPFRHVIPLGTNCYAAWLIKALNLRNAAYPFDWIFSHPAMVADMLADRFARFLDPREHVRSPDDLADPHPPRCDHLGYREAFGVRHVFNHHDVTAAAGLDHFRRAADRFLAVTGGRDKVLLLMVNNVVPVRQEGFATLARAVDDLGARNTLLCINVGCTGDTLDMGMGEPFQIGRHRLRTYRSTSVIDGVRFTNPLDDLVLRSVVAQFDIGVMAPTTNAVVAG